MSNIDSTTNVNHTDTVINGKHIIIDTCIKRDTVYIERTTYDTELKVIEQIINRPDFGKGILSTLVLTFVIIVLLKKRFKR
tara:strand:- start:345 stop:587 length:243 start_codon:yes stop_codon:yes gene_type:complete